MTLAQDSDTSSRQENTSPNSAARSQGSGSKYDGDARTSRQPETAEHTQVQNKQLPSAPATAELKATRKPTSGPSRTPTNRTPAAWNGTVTWTAVEGGAHHPAPSPTSNANAPRPSGQTPASGSRHNSQNKQQQMPA